MKRLVALLMAGFLLAVLASCSSEDSGTNDSTDESVESSTTESTEGSSSNDSDTPNIGNLDDCVEAGQAYAAIVAAPLAFLGGQATEDQIAEWESQVDDLEGKIPDDLADDYRTVADAYAAFGDALEGLSITDFLNPDTQQSLQDASEALDDPAVEQAQQNIQDYFDSECQR